MSLDLLDDPTLGLSDEDIMALAAEHGLLEPVYEPFLLSDLKIISKSRGKGGGSLVSLTPNESQEMYLDDIASYCPSFDWRNNKFDITGLKLDVLKYRQWGCSTITIGLYLLDCMNHPNVRSAIAAHNPQTTDDLLLIAHTMYEYLDVHRKPGLLYDNRGEMRFNNGSTIRVANVGSKGALRGWTGKNLLMSERAFWPSNGNEIEFGILQGFPMSGNVVRETTANGLETFYHQYKLAEANKSQYKALFYGWSPHKDYSVKPERGFVATEEEKELQRLYRLTDGQLCFRREKTKEADRLGKKFEQEYPLNATEAFIGSGNHYYNNNYLLKLADFMRSEEGLEVHRPLYEVEQGENGFHAGFKVWKEPEPGRNYIGGADPAGGVSKNNTPNNASFHLFDLESWEEVVHYHGNPDPWDFGVDIAAIATWYNDANVAVLRLNHGHETIRAMRECSCMGIMCDEDSQYGIIENSRTKVQMDDKLGTIFNEMACGEPGLVLHSVETIEECITYSHLPGGKAGAEGEAFDDRQSSLKCVVSQFTRDDRRYKVPLKEPEAPSVYYGSRR